MKLEIVTGIKNVLYENLVKKKKVNWNKNKKENDENSMLLINETV